MKLKISYKLWIFTFILFNCFSVFAVEPPSTNSKAAIAMEAGSGTVLYDKNMNTKVYPASITKIITAILALENLDLNQNIVATKTALKIPWDSSSAYIKEGEILTVDELLHCLLIYSGNDAANVLAEAVSGNIQDFVKLMNTKAKELGCTGTNFVNAHGYSDDNHYTTALDVAKIFNYCIQNEHFVKIISTKLYIVPETNKTKSKRYLYNTNRLLLTKSENKHGRYYEYAIGGKTGYTNEAGRTLVTLGKKDDKTIIIAVFKASQVNGQDARYTDAINLFNYSFDNFSRRTFDNKENYSFDYINYETNLKYKLNIKDNLELLLKNDETITTIAYELKLDETNLSTVTKETFKENEDYGDITFTINTDKGSYNATYDITITELKTLNIVKEPEFTTIFIICLVVVMLIISLVVKAKRNKNKKETHSALKDKAEKEVKSTLKRKANRTRKLNK
ncbi:MAG: D-alanyl-D-alanine carboxypeptidase [Clostridia bacterium]|nr:D-alanyl-D-alanine carboxypeptidase [Clostridia bacterium]